MTKPIGYWTSYTPAQNSYLDEIQLKYGSRLESLSLKEKMFLIISLSTHLACTSPGECRDEIYGVAHELKGLPASDQEGMIAALIEQIRNKVFNN
jgi:hypothetical protein